MGAGGEKGIEGGDGARATERRELIKGSCGVGKHAGTRVEGDEADAKALAADVGVGLLRLEDVLDGGEAAGDGKASDSDFVDIVGGTKARDGGSTLEGGDELVEVALVVEGFDDRPDTLGWWFRVRFRVKVKVWGGGERE